MAIDTTAKKLAMMALGDPGFEVAFPLPTGSLDQSDLQNMLYGYIDPLWSEAVAASTELACVAFAEGTVAAIAFAEGTVAAIAFAEGSVAVITFTATSCD